jgi:hypothetical protein
MKMMRIVILKDCTEIRYYKTHFFVRIDHSHFSSFHTIVHMFVSLTFSISQIELDSTELLRVKSLYDMEIERRGLL